MVSVLGELDTDLQVCEVCSRGDDAPKILLCDSCDKGVCPMQRKIYVLI